MDNTTSTTHAALTVPSPGQIRVERVPTKGPESGEILVSPLYVGICGTDLDLLRGTRPLSTQILGHEGVAKIMAVGPGTSHFSVGQQVTFLPNNPNDPADVLGIRAYPNNPLARNTLNPNRQQFIHAGVLFHDHVRCPSVCQRLRNCFLLREQRPCVPFPFKGWRVLGGSGHGDHLLEGVALGGRERRPSLLT